MHLTIKTVSKSFLLFVIILLGSCKGIDKQIVADASLSTQKTQTKTNPQIAEYVRHIFQDSRGNMWLGTGGYGVALYDGEELRYFSNEQNFHGQQINGISEDPAKNVWFATNQGIVKYSPIAMKKGDFSFVNYPSSAYFNGQHFWSIFADSKGRVWAGTARGIYRYDGMVWTPFDLPYSEKVSGDFITKRTTWGIEEDKEGNIWFSTNGYGVYKYSGNNFQQYTKEDGLSDNSVDVILEDQDGNIWFGMRFGGIDRFDGQEFNSVRPQGSLGTEEVCEIYEDQDGNIWWSAEGYGVYRYDGKDIVNFSKDEGLGVMAVQTIFQDKDGRLWVGGGGGLYRLEEGRFMNVTKNGPWK